MRLDVTRHIGAGERKIAVDELQNIFDLHSIHKTPLWRENLVEGELSSPSILDAISNWTTLHIIAEPAVP